MITRDKILYTRYNNDETFSFSGFTMVHYEWRGKRKRKIDVATNAKTGVIFFLAHLTKLLFTHTRHSLNYKACARVMERESQGWGLWEDTLHTDDSLAGPSKWRLANPLFNTCFLIPHHLIPFTSVRRCWEKLQSGNRWRASPVTKGGVSRV